MVAVEGSVLRNGLELYLRRVREGESILITEGGRPIAELRPYGTGATDLEERLQELAAEGVIRLPTRPKSPAIPRIIPSGGPVSGALSADREDRF